MDDRHDTSVILDRLDRLTALVGEKLLAEVKVLNDNMEAVLDLLAECYGRGEWLKDRRRHLDGVPGYEVKE